MSFLYYSLPKPDAPTDRDAVLARWDQGDGKADAWWCVSCFEHRTWRTIVDAALTYWCPSCVDERTA